MGGKIIVSAALLIGPMTVFCKLADNYHPSNFPDSSTAIIALSWSQLRSPAFHKFVPVKFREKLRRFHLWVNLLHSPELVAFFELLEFVSMGFLIQLEVLCTDNPQQPCQQINASKCTGCRYKTRTIGVSANGKVTTKERHNETNHNHSHSTTLLKTAIREVREEMNIILGSAASPTTQDIYRSAMTQLLTEMVPYGSKVKIPAMFYDYNKTRLHILFVGYTDIHPIFQCDKPDSWQCQMSWDIYVNNVSPGVWSMAQLISKTNMDKPTQQNISGAIIAQLISKTNMDKPTQQNISGAIIAQLISKTNMEKDTQQNISGASGIRRRDYFNRGIL
jgi:hypothetical protein